ncbi:vacuolar fusion protein CCZ1 homolog [Anopheles gambiae]|uniref:vacuolar fusion protein CCZ1 homolog n=1 Tax=Anopheles gambiae TaxID=7165 RepID=UPI002AC93803|nr:vacuolar fusion protein CCZ1 homolog [Anopheles gambiae]
MTNPVLTAELALKSFYIFNSAFGPKEGEEEKKVLFYHPQDTDIDTKIKDVGLSEAIIKFSNTFTKDDSVQTMHTQKTCQFYYQPEPGYWMIMTLSVPFDRKTRDSGDYNEYHGDTIHDTIYQSVLRQAYRMFRMFHGTFQDNLRPNEELDAQANLIGRLEAFYQSYILHLQMKRCDVVDAFGSVQYLPLNQLLFLRVQNFINMIEATFAPIKHCIFLYSDQVVWSGINPTDLYTLYEYFHSPMFDQLAQSKQTRPAYVTEQGKCKRYTLMVCRKVQNISLCLLLDDGAVENEQSLYLELNAVVNPQLTAISSDISQHLQSGGESSYSFGCGGGSSSSSSSSSRDDSSPKFIFFNELNLQHRGTVRLGQAQYHSVTGSGLPNDVMNLIVDLLDDVRSNRSSVMDETIVKTHDDYWIVKRSCNTRHVFIILNKSSTLIDVTEETKKILDQHVKGIFF